MKTTFLLALPFVALLAGCATRGATATSSAPVELNGTRWKLVVLSGRMDGRVVAFRKVGPGYEGTLAEPGPRLQGVAGVQPGAWVFKVRPKATNEYEGSYRAYGSDGSMAEREVKLFVQGDTLSWDLESATWELQK